ncbi:hypothetical protein QEZ54_33660 [Catellatospora sp. KI3]|uniref:hypothetical protein n=1 Tax=Catellatospora sp. KI3 TaxID=3041620 RepID=UPI002482B6AD|nr:hypothetical protein [Catellatospora sp. KI3]MDI1465933.1 hypothetical protein [Catellatospora sp. KI3]
MPELTESDPMAEAFFQFRMEAPHEVAVPGAAAVRRTVKRRRTARMTALSVVAGLVLAAGGYAFGAGSGSGQVDPAAPTSTRPLTDDQLQALGVQALGLLGYTPEHTRPGMMFGPVSAGSNGFTYSFAAPSGAPMPAGEYQLRAVCLGGVGEVRVRWQAPDGRTDVMVPCDATIADRPIVLTVSGEVTITLRGDDQAAGHAGIAVTLTNPNVVRVKQLLAVDRGEYYASTFGELETSVRDLDNTVTSGPVRMDVFCAGSGAVTARLSLGASSDTAHLLCNGQAQMVTLRLPAGARGESLILDLEPDAEARLASAFAMRLYRE